MVKIPLKKLSSYISNYCNLTKNDSLEKQCKGSIFKYFYIVLYFVVVLQVNNIIVMKRKYRFKGAIKLLMFLQFVDHFLKVSKVKEITTCTK